MVFESLIKFRSATIIFDTAISQDYSNLNVDLPVNGLMLQIVVTTSHYYESYLFINGPHADNDQILRSRKCDTLVTNEM